MRRPTSYLPPLFTMSRAKQRIMIILVWPLVWAEMTYDLIVQSYHCWRGA